MKPVKAFFRALAAPFRSGDRLEIGLVVVFLLINGLVLVNACLHDPRIGYDSLDHLNYIQALSRLRLVTPQDSYEFFSPPLPYAIPALFLALTKLDVFWAAKLAQFVNVFLSIGLTWYLLKVCQLIDPNSPALKLGTLVFLGILPVYYKSFAFVRGEPFVAFFAVLVLYYSLLMFLHRERLTTVNAIILGLAMGLAILARQWGVFLIPPVFLLFIFLGIGSSGLRLKIFKIICLLGALIVIVNAWFYGSLYLKYGSFSAFNRESASHFSLRNQPLEFYIKLSPQLLFHKPIRPGFPNQFWPIFYSEVWGDYWGYFTVYGRDTRDSTFLTGSDLERILSKGSPNWLETNYKTIGAYLGRVNLVSIFPSTLALVALLLAVKGIFPRRAKGGRLAQHSAPVLFLLLLIGATLAGYFWFLIMYPNIGKGDTIKANYVLQVFPFIAILVGILLAQVKQKPGYIYGLILVGLGFVFIHHIFALVTHYPL